MAHLAGVSAKEKDEFERIVVEQDFPAFASRYLWLQGKKPGLERFNLWPMQLEIYNDRVQNEILRSILLKCRQGGGSRAELGLGFFRAITHADYTVLVMGHEKALPTEFLEVIRIFIYNLPEWMGIRVKSDSQSGISFEGLRSSINIGSGAMVMEGAGAKLGRTIHFLHVTEASDPRWRQDAFNMLFQTVPIDGEIHVESTAKGARGWFYEEYGLAKAGNSTFKSYFSPWFQNPFYKFKVPRGFRATEREQALMQKLGIALEQIVFRREKVRELRSENAFLELYPEDDVSCFQLSGAGYFDGAKLKFQLEDPDHAGGNVPGIRGTLRAETVQSRL